MPKDTKSSGYNKAPACESRGFGYKKEGANFDTPSRFEKSKSIDVLSVYRLSMYIIKIYKIIPYIHKLL